MRTVSTIARFLLGGVFLVFGLNGFLHFIHMPPPEGLAAQFTGAIFASGFWVVIFSLQVIPAILLLVNRFVPLALTLLGPVIVNIFCFHAFMLPSGLPLAIVVVILWFLVYHRVRAAFAGLYRQSYEN
jgi:putative oxidoreductase